MEIISIAWIFERRNIFFIAFSRNFRIIKIIFNPHSPLLLSFHWLIGEDLESRSMGGPLHSFLISVMTRIAWGHSILHKSNKIFFLIHTIMNFFFDYCDKTFPKLKLLRFGSVFLAIIILRIMLVYASRISATCLWFHQYKLCHIFTLEN